MNLENFDNNCLVDFNINTINIGTCTNLTYRGVKCIKNPMDYVMYQIILFTLKPDLIIEIGTSYGGSSLYLADLLDIIGQGEIHTIDVKDICSDKTKSHKRIKRFTDGFENYDISNIDGFNNILIIDDGSHQYNDVIKAFNKFNKFVSDNSYYIIEDGIIEHLGISDKYNGGPLKAIRDILSINNDFVIDRYLCDMFGKNCTCNVNGYLKKVK